MIYNVAVKLLIGIAIFYCVKSAVSLVKNKMAVNSKMCFEGFLAMICWGIADYAMNDKDIMIMHIVLSALCLYFSVELKKMERAR